MVPSSENLLLNGPTGNRIPPRMLPRTSLHIDATSAACGTRRVLALHVVSVAVYLLIVGVCFGQVRDGNPLKVDDLLTLQQNGLTEGALLQLVEANRVIFDGSVASIVRLKQAGLSEAVIRAVIASALRDAPAGLSLDDAGFPPAAGVYFQAPQGFASLQPEVFHITQKRAELAIWQHLTVTGTAVASAAGVLGPMVGPIVGAIFENILDVGFVHHPYSGARPQLPARLILRSPEGVTPQQYWLVRLETAKTQRSFRVRVRDRKRGVIAMQDGLVAVHWTSVGPQVFSADLDGLTRGEYRRSRATGHARPTALRHGDRRRLYDNWHDLYVRC